MHYYTISDYIILVVYRALYENEDDETVERLSAVPAQSHTAPTSVQKKSSNATSSAATHSSNDNNDKRLSAADVDEDIMNMLGIQPNTTSSSNRNTNRTSSANATTHTTDSTHQKPTHASSSPTKNNPNNRPPRRR